MVPTFKMKKQVQVKTSVLPWNDKIWVHIPFLKLYGLAILKQPTMYCRIKQVSKHTDNNGSQASTLFPSIKKKA